MKTIKHIKPHYNIGDNIVAMCDKNYRLVIVSRKWENEWQYQTNIYPNTKPFEGQRGWAGEKFIKDRYTKI